MPPAAAFTASGASVVNFLSEWLEVEVNRDGKVYQMEFARGVKASDLKVVGKSNKTGTKVTFKPDAQVFPDVEFKYEMLIGRLRELAYLNQGLQIIVEDERIGKREVFKYENGLVEYVQSLNEGKIVLHPVIYFKKEDAANRLIVEVAMQYSDGFNETLLTFANNINNHDGGTHLSGFKTALTGTINRYAESANLMKDIRPSGDDVREGLGGGHQRQNPRAAVRKPDEGQAAEPGDRIVRPAGGQRKARVVFRGESRRRPGRFLKRGCWRPRRARRPARPAS